MPRTRRNFSAKFKSELVIELLKGEKDLICEKSWPAHHAGGLVEKNLKKHLD